ncbi:MAG: hypothetical protein JXJ04_10500 [Spirochaetales bacterium]|nr:hypothetical protein [Spirochaetales bacterium]
MKKYYIQVKENNKETLKSLIVLHLKLSEDEADYLISIGAVWDKNTNLRLKNPDARCRRELLIVHKPDYEVPVYPFHSDDIIYEDNSFLIVYKKGKYPTVPTPYSDVNSLSYALQGYYDKKKAGITTYVINRLDTHAQGLVFFAKNKTTEKYLHRMFQDRKVKKWYLAETAPFDIVKENYLIEDTLEWNEKAKKAKTFIHLLKKSEYGYCYFVRPYTGRTHQIRKHFASYLVPIKGDPVYGRSSRDAVMSLFCFAYVFKHPQTGKKIKVTYLPKDIRERFL